MNRLIPQSKALVFVFVTLALIGVNACAAATTKSDHAGVGMTAGLFVITSLDLFGIIALILAFGIAKQSISPPLGCALLLGWALAFYVVLHACWALAFYVVLHACWATLPKVG